MIRRGIMYRKRTASTFSILLFSSVCLLFSVLSPALSLTRTKSKRNNFGGGIAHSNQQHGGHNTELSCSGEICERRMCVVPGTKTSIAAHQFKFDLRFCRVAVSRFAKSICIVNCQQ